VDSVCIGLTSSNGVTFDVNATGFERGDQYQKGCSLASAGIGAPAGAPPHPDLAARCRT
jgi:hypothetical protein